MIFDVWPISLVLGVSVGNELGVEHGVLGLVGVHSAKAAAGQEEDERQGQGHQDEGHLLSEIGSRYQHGGVHVFGVYGCVGVGGSLHGKAYNG